MLVKPSDFFPSGSFTDGRNGSFIDHVIIYCTRTTGLERTIQICMDPTENRSYHFIIGRNGKTVQTVSLRNTAWHAGSSKLELANERFIGAQSPSGARG